MKGGGEARAWCAGEGGGGGSPKGVPLPGGWGVPLPRRGGGESVCECVCVVCDLFTRYQFTSSRGILSIFVSRLDSRRICVGKPDGGVFLVSLSSECVRGKLVCAVRLAIWYVDSLAFLRVSFFTPPVCCCLLVAVHLRVWL